MPTAGGAVDRLTAADVFQYAGSATPDGRTVVFADNAGLTWSLPLDAAGKPGTPVRISAPQATENWPRLSPDGHDLAYVSFENNRPEVYVRRFPSGAARRRSAA